MHPGTAHPNPHVSQEEKRPVKMLGLFGHAVSSSGPELLAFHSSWCKPRVGPARSCAHQGTGSTQWPAGLGHGTAFSLQPAVSGSQTVGIWNTEAGGWRR